MKLTEDDLEWLDRIGVDSKRMKIIKDNYEKARKYDKLVKILPNHIEYFEKAIEGFKQ